MPAVARWHAPSFRIADNDPFAAFCGQPLGSHFSAELERARDRERAADGVYLDAQGWYAANALKTIDELLLQPTASGQRGDFPLKALYARVRRRQRSRSPNSSTR
jgi:hypothetical protein